MGVTGALIFGICLASPVCLFLLLAAIGRKSDNAKGGVCLTRDGKHQCEI